LYRGEKDADKPWKYKLLSLRGETGVRSEPVKIPGKNPPEEGHQTAQFSVASGISKSNQGYMELGVRPALHDLSAPSAGYAAYSQIEFMDLRVRATHLNLELDSPQFVLQRLDIIDIISLAPLESWIKRWSWGVKTGFTRTYRAQCPDY